MAGAAEPAQAGVQAHRHNVEDRGREIPIYAAALRYIADHAADLFIGLSIKPNGSGRARDELEGRLDQRALAGSIGADDSH